MADLVAARVGGTVELRFTAPSRTTDGLLLGEVAQATLCRQAAPGAVCTPVEPSATGGFGQMRPGAMVRWSDPLPPALMTGPVRPLAYRVELKSGAGRSAGRSDPAYAAAGDAPPAVTHLEASGTRLGTLLRWDAASGAGEVLLERRQLDPPPAAAVARKPPSRQTGARAAPGEPGLTVLVATPGRVDAAQTIDGTAGEAVRYQYRAVRRTTAQVGGRTLEMRSAASAPVEFTWRNVYPPPPPKGLTALGFVAPASSGGTPLYAVDLVWEPVDDPRVSGYLVRRTEVTAGTAPAHGAEQLTPQPVVTPSFHDTTALASVTYRYEVTAVDAKGNRSAPASTVVHRATP